MERRDFIKNTTAACLLLGAIPFTGCVAYRSVGFEESNNKLKIKKGDLLQDKWVLVRYEKADAPILLSKGENGNYHAVLLVCTHKQCEVKPAGTLLQCPCHGAEFSFTGQVLKGPADIDLTRYEISSDEHNLFIHLK